MTKNYHVCKSTVQLHFVQELIAHVQSMESTPTDSSESETASVHSMRLSAAAVGKDPNAPSLQLEIQLQGHTMVIFSGFRQYSLVHRQLFCSCVGEYSGYYSSFCYSGRRSIIAVFSDVETMQMELL